MLPWSNSYSSSGRRGPTPLPSMLITTSEPSVRKSFDAYMAKLRTHEQGHADIALDHAGELQAVAASEVLG